MTIKYKTKKDYYELIEKLEAIEKEYGIGLTDIVCDHENVDITYKAGGISHPDDEDFWDCMYQAAGLAAGERAEDAARYEGVEVDVNALIGEVIF